MYSFKDTLPQLQPNIRLLHAAAGAPSIDIYSNGEVVAQKLSFSNITDYIKVSPGNNNIQIYTAGTYDNPLYEESITLLPNSVMTLSITLLESDLAIFKLNDTSKLENKLDTNIRFINLSPNSPLLSLSLPNGNTLFNGVEYLETTNYLSLSAGIYNFVLEPTEATAFSYFIRDINLRPSYFHTLYIIGLLDEKPRIGSLFVQDGLIK